MSSKRASVPAIAIAEHDHGLVEPDTDATDIGVDVGNAFADRFVDPGLGRDESLVDADLGLVDPIADDVGHLGLLASGLRRDLVDTGGERSETSVDLDAHLNWTPRRCEPRWPRR